MSNKPPSIQIKPITPIPASPVVNSSPTPTISVPRTPVTPSVKNTTPTITPATQPSTNVVIPSSSPTTDNAHILTPEEVDKQNTQNTTSESDSNESSSSNQTHIPPLLNSNQDLMSNLQYMVSSLPHMQAQMQQMFSPSGPIRQISVPVENSPSCPGFESNVSDKPKQKNKNTYLYRSNDNNECVSLEYIWISNSGHETNKSNKGMPTMRSKTRTLYLPKNTSITMDHIPTWDFDGSSTEQAPTEHSEITLNPCRIHPNPFNDHRSFLVLCDLYVNDKPHPDNNRIKLNKMDKDHEPWYGFEQEYILMERIDERHDWPNNTKVIGWPNTTKMRDQGPFYCSIGADNAFGRQIADEHYHLCLKAKLMISGYNAEVMPGQWEYQIGPVEGSKRAGDHLWLSRYILVRVAEKHNLIVNFHPKPNVKGNYNGSGLHTNFSTIETRQPNGFTIIEQYIDNLKRKHDKTIEYYGMFNNLRMTGSHETSKLNTCKSGVGDRGAAIRIPTKTHVNKKGYFEDRRPASNADPYLICYALLAAIYNYKI